MVRPATIVFGVTGAVGIGAGFAVDRAMADMPYRVERRVPDIARPREPEDYHYYDDEAPSKPGGWFVNPALIWGPALLAVGAVGGIFAARSTIPLDRIWHATPMGRAAIGTAIVGAGITLGASSSRLALG